MLRRAPVDVSFALSASLLAALTVWACSTDNGDTSHGPKVGPLPQREGGTRADGAADDAADGSSSGKPGDGGELDGPDGCTGTVAVLAGDDASLGGAVQAAGGPWSVAAIAGGAARSKPALAAFGAGFIGATHGAADALQSTALVDGAWTAAVAFGNAGVKGAPTIAVLGAKAHVVYSAGPGANRDFFHGIHDGGGWNAATADVGSPHSFGTVSAALAPAGAEVVFAENGSDDGAEGGGLYVRAYGASWSAAAPVTGIGTVGATLPSTPELVPLEGKNDLLLVYVEKGSRRIASATRDAATKSWTVHGPIHPDVNTAEKLAAARIGAGKVLVAFRGQDGNAYHALGTITDDAATWTPAASIGGAGPVAVDSTAAVAPGVCGDEAVLAYATEGVVRVTRLRGGGWSAPETLTGLPGRRVAIASRQNR